MEYSYKRKPSLYKEYPIQLILKAVVSTAFANKYNVVQTQHYSPKPIKHTLLTYPFNIDKLTAKTS